VFGSDRMSRCREEGIVLMGLGMLGCIEFGILVWRWQRGRGMQP